MLILKINNLLNWVFLRFFERGLILIFSNVMFMADSDELLVNTICENIAGEKITDISLYYSWLFLVIFLFLLEYSLLFLFPLLVNSLKSFIKWLIVLAGFVFVINNGVLLLTNPGLGSYEISVVYSLSIIEYLLNNPWHTIDYERFFELLWMFRIRTRVSAIMIIIITLVLRTELWLILKEKILILDKYQQSISLRLRNKSHIYARNVVIATFLSPLYAPLLYNQLAFIMVRFDEFIGVLPIISIILADPIMFLMKFLCLNFKESVKRAVKAAAATTGIAVSTSTIWYWSWRANEVLSGDRKRLIKRPKVGGSSGSNGTAKD